MYRSPQQTADIFQSIVMNHDEVDIEKAITVGGGIGSGGRDDYEDGNDTNGSGYSGDLRLSAQEILLSLPGINHSNYRDVMNTVTDLAELSTLSEIQLISLIGNINAKKLYTFLRQRIV